MKILKLDIEGFRSMKKVHWVPNDLNVIIGPNGAGKSNLLRFLELMSISAQARLGKHIQEYAVAATDKDTSYLNNSFTPISQCVYRDATNNYHRNVRSR